MRVKELLKEINKVIEELYEFKFYNIVQFENELYIKILKTANRLGVKGIRAKDSSYISYIMQNELLKFEMELFKIKRYFNLHKQNNKIAGFGVDYIKCDLCNELDSNILEMELTELPKYIRNGIDRAS